MLQWLGETASHGKLRLFACACARHLWHLPLDNRCRNAVETAERFVAGLATTAELRAACDAAYDTHQDIVNGRRHPSQVWDPYTLAPQACACCAGVDAPSAAFATARYVADVLTCSAGADVGMDPEDPGFDQALSHVRAKEERIQADLLRDIFGLVPGDSTDGEKR